MGREGRMAGNLVVVCVLVALIGLAAETANASSHITAAPTDFEFPATAVGETSSIPVIVTNVGQDAITVSMAGGAPGDPNFRGSQNCQGKMLQPGDTCEVTYTFQPTTTGTHSASTSFSINGMSFPITMTGMGVDPTATTTTTTTTTTTATTTTPTAPTPTTTTTTLPGETLAVDDTISTEAGRAVVIPVLANDIATQGDLDPGSVGITQVPARGVATPQADGTIDYQPDSGYVGIDRFTYQVCNTEQVCAMATVTVDVAACAVDQRLTQSFTLEPDSGAHGDLISLDLQLNSERLAECFTSAPIVRFTLGDEPVDGPEAVDASGRVLASVEVPDNLEEGDYSVIALLGEISQPVAEAEFTIDPTGGQGLPPWVLWGGVGVVAIIGTTFLGRWWGRRGIPAES